jgi:hypothetical protein
MHLFPWYTLPYPSDDWNTKATTYTIVFYVLFLWPYPFQFLSELVYNEVAEVAEDGKEDKIRILTEGVERLPLIGLNYIHPPLNYQPR